MSRESAVARGHGVTSPRLSYADIADRIGQCVSLTEQIRAYGQLLNEVMLQTSAIGHLEAARRLIELADREAGRGSRS